MTVTMLAAYAFGVALIVAAGAWILERGMMGARLPIRWVWIGALGLSIGLPVAAFVSGAERGGGAGGTGLAEGIAPIALTGISVETGGDGGPALGAVLEPLADGRAGLSRALASVAALLPAGRRVEAGIAGTWIVASLVAGLVFLASMRRLRRRAREWPEEALLGWPLKVSPDMGPATVGLIKPLIVIPRWARELPPRELELVLRHEGEHVRSRDTLVLALGLVAVVACPWNPLVWWQMRRLKEAVEVDCDRRVLRDGVAPARYGNLLVSLGTRGRFASIAVPTIAGPTSLLERRLTVMANMRERISLARVLAATAVALLLLIVACTTDPPVATDARAGAEPPATRARAGSMPLDDTVVAIWVDRDGAVQVNGVVTPVDGIADAVASFSARRAVASLEAHEAAPYRVLADVQNQLRGANLLRVVFTTVASEAQRSPPRDAATLVDAGLAVVLPDTTMPNILPVGSVSSRNLLFLEVLPTGIVAARRGEDPSVREITPRDVEGLWRREVASNSNLIAVVQTHVDAEYRHMFDVLAALRRADARRFTLQALER